MLIRRSYIDAAHIADPQLNFLWDEWNVKATYEPVRPEEVKRLGGLSRRANAAFAIAIGEWVLARFEGMDADPEPGLFLQAAWAAVIDPRYVREIEIVDEEWRGPVRGPISMALTFVIDALFAEEAGPNASFNPAWAAVFARHVLPTARDFDAWFAFVLDRLEPLYPCVPDADADWFEQENNWGAPVPAEAFDPARTFALASAEPLIQGLLARLDPERNPFLLRPRQMLEYGFKGTPYRFPAF